MEILRHAYFRVTRDADFTVSDEADDLLRAVEDELRRRRFGEVVRLEVVARHGAADARLPDRAAGRCEEEQVVDVDGLLDLQDLWRSTSWTASASCATRPGHRCRSPSRPSTRTAAPTCSPPCARATSSCTIHTTRSRAAWSASSQQAVDDPDVLAHQDDRVPDLGRLGAGAVADRGGGARQAGGLPRGAEGALRRAAQHRLGRARWKRRAPTSCTACRGSRPTRRRCSSCAARAAACATTCTSVPATTTRRPRASTRTSGSSRATATLTADVAELFNTLTGAARAPGYRKAMVAPERMRDGLLDEIRKTIEATSSPDRRPGSS